ncbi:uncharacterized protein LOC143146153 [Ptiloglossa arizonensis]|uniref:uncharacterized protein LOC143146153 n=1 Tax=Ptiloglossa arizonensis TaxID=3350558 RepID=UPI003FA09C2F
MCNGNYSYAGIMNLLRIRTIYSDQQYGARWTRLFRVSDDQNESSWSLFAAFRENEGTVIRDQRLEAQKRPRTRVVARCRGHGCIWRSFNIRAHLIAEARVSEDPCVFQGKGVPEPALSEPAQQLIGVRSGGERGHYCTTTPRLEEIQFNNRRWLTARRSPHTGEKRLDDT